MWGWEWTLDLHGRIQLGIPPVPVRGCGCGPWPLHRRTVLHLVFGLMRGVRVSSTRLQVHHSRFGPSLPHRSVSCTLDLNYTVFALSFAPGMSPIGTVPDAGEWTPFAEENESIKASSYYVGRCLILSQNGGKGEVFGSRTHSFSPRSCLKTLLFAGWGFSSDLSTRTLSSTYV
jgi:hypothetical protein